MSVKVLVPRPVSEEFRALGIERGLSLAFWSRLHAELPHADRADRRTDRSFFHQIPLVDDFGRPHLFRVVVDDGTAENTLVVEGIRHVTFDDLDIG